MIHNSGILDCCFDKGSNLKTSVRAFWKLNDLLLMVIVKKSLVIALSHTCIEKIYCTGATAVIFN